MSDIKKDFSEEEFEPNLIELDGEMFEILDTLEHEGVNYFALAPYDEDSDEIEEFLVLKQIDSADGKFTLATVDDDATEDLVGDMFAEQFDELFELYGEDDE